MRILVLGGTRFMGRHLVRELLSRSHEVTVANRGISEDDFENRVHRIVFERTDAESIHSQLSGKYFDVVFDSLAYCSNDIKILLDNIRCGRYVFISSTAVYNKHMNTNECEFDPFSVPVDWCGRGALPYSDAKRQAERAIFQNYAQIGFTAVRFPFVIGKDDYTNRLYFYVEHILRKKPMKIDNFDNQMAFVRSDEAGRFLAFLAEHPHFGAINGASTGTISVKDIAAYVKKHTGKEIILSDDGDCAPYNGENAYSINTDLAQGLGFTFTPLHDWIYALLDYYIEMAI